jgi:hypothetical protein
MICPEFAIFSVDVSEEANRQNPEESATADKKE